TFRPIEFLTKSRHDSVGNLHRYEMSPRYEMGFAEGQVPRERPGHGRRNDSVGQTVPEDDSKLLREILQREAEVPVEDELLAKRLRASPHREDLVQVAKEELADVPPSKQLPVACGPGRDQPIQEPFRVGSKPLRPLADLSSGQTRTTSTGLQRQPSSGVHTVERARQPGRAHPADERRGADPMPKAVSRRQRVRRSARDADHAELIEPERLDKVLYVRYGFHHARAIHKL